MFQTLAAASFQSLWYWLLHVVVWTLACYRTLGVPVDMLVRARRQPEIADRVDLLAHLTVERVTGVHDRMGAAIAAATGFLLAALASLGFLARLETAQAALVLALPLAIIQYSKLRLALAIKRQGITGPALVLALARRRTWHQVFAVTAMLAAAATSLALHPPIPMP